MISKKLLKIDLIPLAIFKLGFLVSSMGDIEERHINKNLNSYMLSHANNLERSRLTEWEYNYNKFFCYHTKLKY